MGVKIDLDDLFSKALEAAKGSYSPYRTFLWERQS
jgi:hypothetical protein